MMLACGGWIFHARFLSFPSLRAQGHGQGVNTRLQYLRRNVYHLLTIACHLSFIYHVSSGYYTLVRIGKWTSHY